MNVSKINLWPSDFSVPSRINATKFRAGNLICAVLLAALVMFGGTVRATNVLVNPGAETGNLNGWIQSLTGYIFVVSTNSQVNGQNILAHSGSNVFELFNTTETTTYLYQDYAAIAGSQWSASCGCHLFGV
jgi:hypothetical protein